MMRGYISGIGLAGEGFIDWARAQPALARGELPASDPDARAAAPPLPANERRRTTPLIRLALQVAHEAAAAAQLPPDSLPSVFASADGDSGVVDKICRSMQLPGHPVSPTDFHNSVHNAPAAYWSFCSGAQAASTSIAGGDHSFTVGLLEAMSQLADAEAVLLVAYDLPLPPPLHAQRPISAAFALGMVLSRERLATSCASLSVALDPAAHAASRCAGALEARRTGNAAARALPLLCSLAAGVPARLALPYPPAQTLTLVLQPC